MKFTLQRIKSLQDGARINALNTCVKSISMTKLINFIFLALSLYPITVNAGSIDVLEDSIKVRFKAYKVTMIAEQGEQKRFGVGYGYRNNEIELHVGLHDNLKPFGYLSYKPEKLRAIFDVGLESNERDYTTYCGGTLLLSDSFGVRVVADTKNHIYVGVRKWF